MLDVLHVLFEESLEASSEDQLKSREMARKRIYTGLYERATYSWASSSPAQSNVTASGDMMADGGTAPALTHKPYIPPTSSNVDAPLPFGKVLDAPLG